MIHFKSLNSYNPPCTQRAPPFSLWTNNNIRDMITTHSSSPSYITTRSYRFTLFTDVCVVVAYKSLSSLVGRQKEKRRISCSRPKLPRKHMLPHKNKHYHFNTPTQSCLLFTRSQNKYKKYKDSYISQFAFNFHKKAVTYKEKEELF